MSKSDSVLGNLEECFLFEVILLVDAGSEFKALLDHCRQVIKRENHFGEQSCVVLKCFLGLL